MKIGKLKNAWPLSDASLTTRFGFYSFVCIGIMTAALWYIVSNYMISQMLQREWETVAQVIRADIKEYLAEEDFKTEDRKSVGHKFNKLLEHVKLLPNIVRFKVFNPKSMVIWSDDKRLVGKAFPEDDELQEALRGEVVADMSSLEKKENEFEQGSFGRLIEVYIPIYKDDDKKELLGVFEIYKRADSIYGDVRNARMVVLVGALGGGLLLYLSLFAIVRQAAKQIEQQQKDLFHVQSELIASQRMAAVGAMAAAVAHGIGNPLSSIRAAAQVAMLDATAESNPDHTQKTSKNLQNIMEQVDRVQKRMQGLLNFAKPMEPRLALVELNRLLQNVVDVLETRFAESGVKPKLDLDKDLPKLFLDANHVEQVFMGIITNAVEASPRGGTVTIRTKVEPGNGSRPKIVVSVNDTGVGIPVENRGKIFEPFFTTKAQGTGIGLPLAKKFVERNGGEISISDAPFGGAKIEVTFPWQELS
jgi:two-component system sensor histidine kinase HydH